MAGKANVLFISIKYVYKIPNQSQKRKALIGRVAGEIKKLLNNTFKTLCHRKSAKGKNQETRKKRREQRVQITGSRRLGPPVPGPLSLYAVRTS